MLVERMRTIQAPPETVIAALVNLDNMSRLLSRAERIEVLQQSEGRARLAVTVALGKLGHRRVEGEARLLDDGLRFIAVTPTQIDVRWRVRSLPTGSEVLVRVDVDLKQLMGPLARLGDSFVGRQVGVELDRSLAALDEIVTSPATG